MKLWVEKDEGGAYMTVLTQQSAVPVIVSVVVACLGNA